MNFSNYSTPSHIKDEVFNDLGKPHTYYEEIVAKFQNFSKESLIEKNTINKLSFLNQGITFQVYNRDQSTEHVFPFDLFPRIITPDEWTHIEKGVIQRNKALNLFIKDVYNDKKIFKAGIVPWEMIASSEHYTKQMEDFIPAGEIYTHIAGTDIIKHSDGNYYVLEDNLRSPSGVSYVLNNRIAMKKTFRELFKNNKVHQVDDYPFELLSMLQSVSNNASGVKTIALLTPGVYNSAYYEHVFLAQQMGVELVEGRDLVVEDKIVYKKTIKGKKRLDVIYRRIDDQP